MASLAGPQEPARAVPRPLSVGQIGPVERKGAPANALDRFVCGDLPRSEPLNATPDDERSFVLQVQPCQFEQVEIDPIAHDVIVGRREGLFDDRNRRKRPKLDRRRVSEDF